MVCINSVHRRIPRFLYTCRELASSMHRVDACLKEDGILALFPVLVFSKRSGWCHGC